MKAEAWARAHVSYFDKKAYREEIESRRARVQMCKDPKTAAMPEMQCKYAEAYYQAGLRRRRADFVRHPSAVDCRGASPSPDGHHFFRFRCRAVFQARRSDVRVAVTGKNRAVWKWL